MPEPISHNNRHAELIIPLKSRPVDVGIIPLIQWLNSYDSIFTLYSCQGDDREFSSYVVFICLDGNDLRKVLRRFHHICDRWIGPIKTEVTPLNGVVCYTVRFQTTKLLNYVQENLNHLNPSFEAVMATIPVRPWVRKTLKKAA